jgi:hypothetical protein
MGDRGVEVVAERAAMASHAVRRRRPLARLDSSPALILACATAVVLGTAPAASAQAPDKCRVLCAPELKVEPTFTIENLFRPPVVEMLDDGVAVARGREQRERVFELIFALDVPTAVPRVGLTLEASFKPFGATDVNPFTGSSAASLGRSSIRDNSVEIEAEVNFSLFDVDQTGGWASSHIDVVDQFSPAHRPGDGSAFTHKLDFEWDTAFQVFKRLPEDHWLRNVEVEVSLDYLATGLPKAGDVLDDERFVDAASPWSLSFVLVVPLAPLAP